MAEREEAEKAVEIEAAGTIELARPVMVDGAPRREFPYDVTLVTPAQFLAAEAAVTKGGKVFGVCEFDYAFHMHLGFQAVLAAEPALDIKDLERVTGPDLMKFMAVGRFFMNAPDESVEPTSGAESEATPGDSRPQ